MKRNLPGRVYYVSSDKDDTVLLGLDVKINDKMISWFDTVKGRSMEIGGIIGENEKKFVFKRSEGEGGQVYTFVLLDLEIYEKSVRKWLTSSKSFDNEESMLEAFEKSREDAW